MDKNVIPFPPSLNFGPAINDATVDAMERAAQSPARGQARRLSLVALASDRETLLRIAAESPDLFDDMAQRIASFRVHSAAALELAEAACARIEIVNRVRGAFREQPHA